MRASSGFGPLNARQYETYIKSMAFEGVMRHDVLQALPRAIQGDMISVHVREEMRDAKGQTTGLR
jgi:hypothetical protein